MIKLDLETDIKNINKVNGLYKLILHEAINKETTPFNIIIIALEVILKESEYFKI